MKCIFTPLHYLVRLVRELNSPTLVIVRLVVVLATARVKVMGSESVVIKVAYSQRTDQRTVTAGFLAFVVRVFAIAYLTVARSTLCPRTASEVAR